MDKRELELFDQQDIFTLEEVGHLWLSQFKEAKQANLIRIRDLLIQAVSSGNLPTKEVWYYSVSPPISAKYMEKIQQNMTPDEIVNMPHTPKFPYTSIPMFAATKVSKSELKEWCKKNNLFPWFLFPDKSTSSIFTELGKQGGEKTKLKRGLIEGLQRIKQDLTKTKEKLTQTTLIKWLKENTKPQAPYEFQPEINNFDDVYLDLNIDDEKKSTLCWKLRDGSTGSIKISSAQRYIKIVNEM
jgi:hypothetical protein